MFRGRWRYRSDDGLLDDRFVLPGGPASRSPEVLVGVQTGRDPAEVRRPVAEAVRVSPAFGAIPAANAFAPLDATPAAPLPPVLRIELNGAPPVQAGPPVDLDAPVPSGCPTAID